LASKKLVCGNAIKTKFSKNTFKAIFIQGGLHHIPGKKNIKRVLIECHRILKQNGLLFITEPFNDLFLHTVHLTLAISPWLPKKLASLKTMIHEEKKTYYSWLANVNLLFYTSLTKFRIIKKQVKLGKINLILVKKKK
jgi:ubiquinone/menaquinone biosynthesis C-methylase UbiE